MERLPKDVLVEVLLRVPPHHLPVCARVCRLWRSLARDARLSRSWCARAGLVFPDEARVREEPFLRHHAHKSDADNIQWTYGSRPINWLSRLRPSAHWDADLLPPVLRILDPERVRRNGGDGIAVVAPPMHHDTGEYMWRLTFGLDEPGPAELRYVYVGCLSMPPVAEASDGMRLHSSINNNHNLQWSHMVHFNGKACHAQQEWAYAGPMRGARNAYTFVLDTRSGVLRVWQEGRACGPFPAPVAAWPQYAFASIGVEHVTVRLDAWAHRRSLSHTEHHIASLLGSGGE